MDDVKLLYVNGDSWSAGDIVDPVKFKDESWHVMHPDNDSYRLPKVWPNKVAESLNIKCINNSVAGSSNDGIVRRMLTDIPKLLKEYKPEEIFLIIGWTSPERKDFFYKGKGQNSWDTLYPAEVGHWKDTDIDKNEFYKIYTTRYWNEEEYLTRFINQNMLVAGYLENLGIKFLFFNAFYENKQVVLENDPNRHNIKHSPRLIDYINKYHPDNFKNNIWLETIQLNEVVEQFNILYNKSFIATSFKEYILNIELAKKIRLLEYHPTEEGHQEWANFIAKSIINFSKGTEIIPYYVADNFNQVSLHNPSSEILEIYKDIKEINEVDQKNNRICRPLFSQSDLPHILRFNSLKHSELTKDSEFYYFVTLHHHNFLAARHLNLIPEYVLEANRNGKCKIVLDNTLEGDKIEEFLNELYQSIDRLELKASNIYYITSNLIAENTHDKDRKSVV